MELKEGYKQTEVGVIPKDWEQARLGALLAVPPTYGINAPAIPYDTRYPTYLRITDITEDGRLDKSSLASVNHPASENCSMEDGDMVFARTGASVGKSYLYDPRDGGLTFAGFLIRVRPDIRKLDPRYLKYFVRSQPYWDWITTNSMRSGQPGINGKQYASLLLPLPPTKAEQEAIAEALSDADALIESLEQLVAKKRQIKKGAMQELLTGEKRLPGFSGEWEETTVEANILKSFCGPSPTCEERNIDGSSEWGVLKTTAITWESGWDWKRHKTLPKTYWNQPSIELRKGDVLVTKAGPRHRVGVAAWIDFVPEQIIPSGKMIALRPDPDKAVPLMLSAAIAATDAQTFLDQRTTGMAESQVNYENTVLLETPIKLPPHDEQTAIATILSEMDAEIAALETKLAKARQVKQGMMQELLTGNIRLIQTEKAHA